MIRRILTIAQIVWIEMIRKKDIYVVLILLGAMLVALVSLDIFGLGGVSSFVKETGLLFSWLFGWILAVIVGSRELPQEESRGTVFSLLAKPITRAQVIVGKWFGVWTVVCAALLMFYVLIVAVVRLKGGQFSYPVLLVGFALHCSAMAMISAIALAFSTRMNNDAAAALTFVFTAASLLVVPHVPEFMAQETGLRSAVLMFLYNVLPHFEVFDTRMLMAHNYPPPSVAVSILILAYGAAMTAVFLLIAWLAYRNKRFSRSNFM